MNTSYDLETGALALEAVLMSPGRCPDIPESSNVYGWFVGSWDLDILNYWGKDVSARGIKGEVHASWILEGRAIQDVWIMPPRSERTTRLDRMMNMYGTTLRVWDPTIQAWRITWRNPAGDHHEDQIGRWNGPDIVQLGVRPDGTQTRWSFKKITGQSFHWLGESLASGEKNWKREGEFQARRRLSQTG